MLYYDVQSNLKSVFNLFQKLYTLFQTLQQSEYYQNPSDEGHNDVAVKAQNIVKVYGQYHIGLMRYVIVSQFLLTFSKTRVLYAIVDVIVLKHYYQNPFDEEMNNAVIKTENIVEVYSQCRHSTTNFIQHIDQIRLSHQLDIEFFQTVRPDRLFQQDIVGNCPLTEQDLIGDGDFSFHDDNGRAETSFSANGRCQSLNVSEDFQLIYSCLLTGSFNTATTTSTTTTTNTTTIAVTIQLNP